MKKTDYFESFEKTEDGWFGNLAYGWITDNQEITLTGNTKKEVLEQVYKIRKATEKEKIEIWGYLLK